MTAESGAAMLEFDGAGGAKPVESHSADRGRDDTRFHWIQSDWRDDGLRKQLIDDFGVDPVLTEAALQTDTRPSHRRIGEAVLLILRGANLQPGSDAEDLISVRLVVEKARGFTLSRHRMRTTNQIASMLEAGDGPRNAGEFVAAYVDILVDNLTPVVARLSEDLDDVEDEVLDAAKQARDGPLADVRRRIIKLRRYLAPQREAMDALAKASPEWLSNEDRGRIRETGFRLAKIVDDLDAFRERGQLIQEEILFQISQRLSRNTFMLTLVAGIILPLTLLTGLFGMNVGGIPGGKWPWMFWSIAIGCALFLIVALVILVRRLRVDRRQT